MTSRRQWPEGVATRSLGRADVTALRQLLDAAEAVDQAHEWYSEDDLLEEFDDTDLDLGTNSVGLWSGGTLVGYGLVRSQPEAEELDRLRGEGTIHPEWRRHRLGSWLVDWLLEHAVAEHERTNPGLPAVLVLSGTSTNTGMAALMGAAGFEVSRYFFGMRRRLDHPVAARPVPPGLALTPYRAELDEAVRLTHNQAFRDHWGSAERSQQFWATWMTGTRAFRPAMSRLLLDGDEVVSYVLGYEYDADTAATGIRDCYVGQLGTVRSHRGQGAAQCLLGETLAAAQRAGYDTVSLGVDSASPTGALDLYQRTGFEIQYEWKTYERPL